MNSDHHIGISCVILLGNDNPMTELPKNSCPADGRRAVSGTGLSSGRCDETNLQGVALDRQNWRVGLEVFACAYTKGRSESALRFYLDPAIVMQGPFAGFVV